MEKIRQLTKLENVFLKKGKVSAVRRWDGGEVHEIDVCLPHVNFKKWTTTKKVKIKTASLHFSDYTPSLWNPVDKICTLFIDTSHSGKGSLWAKAQKEGDVIHYLNIESESHYPLPDKKLFLIGDQTSIGHCCALQQLAATGTEVSGLIACTSRETSESFRENCPWISLNAFYEMEKLLDALRKAVEKMDNSDDFTFYLTGSAELVVKARRVLREYIPGSQIKSKGFWQ